MIARRLDHPGCDRQRLLFEDAQNLGSRPTAQAVRFDKPLDGGLTQPDRLRRCRCLVPQIEKPICGEVVSELEHLRVIAPELLTHAAGQTSASFLPALYSAGTRSNHGCAASGSAATSSRV